MSALTHKPILSILLFILILTAGALVPDLTRRASAGRDVGFGPGVIEKRYEEPPEPGGNYPLSFKVECLPPALRQDRAPAGVIRERASGRPGKTPVRQDRPLRFPETEFY